MTRLNRYALSAAMLSAALLLALTGASQQPSLTEAPAGFDNLTNGMVDQATHDTDRSTFFEEVDTPTNGLGPVFNGTSCAGCHSTPVSGITVDGTSGTTLEHREGHTDGSGNFVNPNIVINNGAGVIANRSLVNTFATCPAAQETADPTTEPIQAQRITVNTLGDGFVEAVPDATFLAIALGQRLLTGGKIHGQAIQVPLLEAPGKTRIGRFGWKDQQASLLSFSGDAYLNEQGITSRLLPEDVTEVCDSPDVQDPEDSGAAGSADIDHFAQFMRATKVPPVDSTLASQPDAVAGSRIFEAIGCSMCHVRTMVTAPPGTMINGGTFQVPDALGSKIIHPYGDFLLHDIGTGDGIVQNGPQSTANKLRTAPLWGLRTRTNLMHDGNSTTPSDAILRHAGEASAVIGRYKLLTPTQQSRLLKFLGSL